MDFNCFQRHDLFLLFLSLGLLFISIIAYVRQKDRENPVLWPALIALLLAALGLRLFMAHLDPFLWDWDERYHALVAKNLLHHFLKPTLYDNPVIPYDYTAWDKNHIWLHKQPLAMWQMAISFYLFGINQFTGRFPMVAEGVALIFIIYRIGALTISNQAGYLSALIATVSFYALCYMTGGEATDHVDYALTFYVSASLWAWIEYSQKKQTGWLILIGIFAGLAVLSKWTTGLLVFPAWFVTVLFDKEARTQFRTYLNIAIAFAVSVAVFLPWQLYAYIHYPTEMKYEMHYNQSHLLTVIDGRAETKWYYLEQLGRNYGPIVPYIIIFALIAAWRLIKKKNDRIFIFSALLITYLLFSLVAATKMPAYAYIACVPMFIMLGALALRIQQYIDAKKWGIAGIILILMAWFSINIPGIAKIHTACDPDNDYRPHKVLATAYFKELGKTLPKDVVVFGLPYECEVEMMFYTGNTCYPIVPDENQYKTLKAKGIKMAVFQTDKTPAYLLNNPQVMKLRWMQLP